MDEDTSRIPSVLIVGAGIFGTSTAHHLSQSSTPVRVTIICNDDFPPPPPSKSPNPLLGASYDINKIIRADYSTPFDMQLAYEAMDAWSSWPLLKKFYHRTGWVALNEKGSDLTDRIRANFRTHGRTDPTSDISLTEARKAWGGVLQDATFENISKAYWNPEAGWVEADKAIVAMLTAAVEKGVNYVKGAVTEILMHTAPQTGVLGVRLENGTVLKADKIVLATGAWTSQLMSPLEDSLGFKEKDCVEDQVKAACVCVAHFMLNSVEREEFDRMPVIINGGAGKHYLIIHTGSSLKCSRGDIQPPPASNFLKFTNGWTVTNTLNLSSGRVISAPRGGPQEEVPQALKTETLRLIEGIMPSMLDKGRAVAYWRLCWDSITPTQQQLISKHPDARLKNLYIVAGGSFHSWKFLPIMGKFVVNVLHGVSNGRERDMSWAWKHEGWISGGRRGAHEKAVPKRELRDLENSSRNARL
jgi:sarcosine oxidase/L-pipecolate oxidase